MDDTKNTSIEALHAKLDKSLQSNKANIISQWVVNVLLIFVIAFMIDSKGAQTRLQSEKLDRVEAKEFLRVTSYGTVENKRTKYVVEYMNDYGDLMGIPDSLRTEVDDDFTDKMNAVITVSTMTRSGDNSSK